MAAALILCAALRAAAQEELTAAEKLEQSVETLDDAVSKLKKLKVSGYIQAQYQYADYEADGTNFKLANRANSVEKANKEAFGRIGIRRGRIKFTYESGIVQGVFQPDLTDKGIAFKDVFLSVKDPWIGTNALKAGIFDRPFGYEISYSSSSRESPERARIFQTCFPDERDLGAMLTLQPAKTSAWNVLKLEAGLFAGNGINAEVDSKLDFIGHLSASKTLGNSFTFGGGVSAYFGGVLQTDSTIMKLEDKKWESSKDGGNVGKYSERQYFGVDLRMAYISGVLGLTQLRGEYIFGKQPGNKEGAFKNGLFSGSMYNRNIAGGYVILTQELGKVPLTLVFKYDWLDPNTYLAGDDIKSAADITRSNIGVGAYWRINPALRLTLYYDIVSNETSTQTDGYKTDRKDNVLTLRLQYKF